MYCFQDTWARIVKSSFTLAQPPALTLYKVQSVYLQMTVFSYIQKVNILSCNLEEMTLNREGQGLSSFHSNIAYDVRALEELLHNCVSVSPYVSVKNSIGDWLTRQWTCTDQKIFAGLLALSKSKVPTKGIEKINTSLTHTVTKTCSIEDNMKEEEVTK